MGVEADRDECRGFIFRDHGRSRDGRSGCHLVAAVQGNLDNLPRASVEKLAAARSFPGRLARHLGDARRISRLGGPEHRPAPPPHPPARKPPPPPHPPIPPPPLPHTP